MDQQDIREYNGQRYSLGEGAAIIKELDDRTRYDQPGYNSVAEIGSKVKTLVENPVPGPPGPPGQDGSGSQNRVITLADPTDLAELNAITGMAQGDLTVVTNYLNDKVTFIYDGTNWIRASNYELCITDFGCKGDGVQLTDIAVTNSQMTSNTTVFSESDIGKTVSIANAGADGEHLVTTILSFVDENNVLLSESATSNVTGVTGSYGTDNLTYLQRAFDFAIQNNLKLKAPEGVFLIADDNTDDGSVHEVRLNFTKDNQNFYFKGAGKGLTIFRDLDGKNQRRGRFTSMFYCNQPENINIGKVQFSDFTTDKNGRSLTKQPSSDFFWEQSHCFTFVKSTTSFSNFSELTFSNIEIYDKVGGGITYSTATVLLNSFNCFNITESNFLGIDGGTHPNGIIYGQRADIEPHPISNKINISNCKVRYIQFEPVSSGVSNVNRQRKVFISDCYIGVLEPTEAESDEDTKYHELFVSNCVIEDFVGRGLKYKISNSKLGVDSVLSSVDATFSNCDILLPYDVNNNTVTTLTFNNFQGLKNKFVFANCNFIIDTDLDVQPTGYSLTNTSNLPNYRDAFFSFSKCHFDSRFERIADAFSNGFWVFSECYLSGSVHVFQAGGGSSGTARLDLINNNYDNVNSGCFITRISNTNTTWEINFDEKQDNDVWSTQLVGSTGDIFNQIKKYPTIIIDNISNRLGTRLKGEIFQIKDPQAGSYRNYLVTTQGNNTASVVKGFSLLEA